jgi:16S rRNA processing protein RimM
MNSEKDIVHVGRTQKPYGIRGEIIILFSRVEYAEADSEYYFLMIDGIPVPFFVEELSYTTDVSARVKFEDVDDEKNASKYVNLDVCVLRNTLSDDSPEALGDWHLFVGYDVVDRKGEMLGSIIDVDDSTINVLFIVRKDEEDLLIPATEDFITDVDVDKKIIEMNLPDGLFDR